MAKFQANLPDDVIKEFKKISNNSEKIFGEMTKAGAEVVYKNVLSNMKNSFKDASKLADYLQITKTYRTISDSGINTKVGFYGYYKKGERTHKVTRKAKEGYEYKTGKGYRQNRSSSGVKATTYTYDGIPVPLIVIAREYGTSRGEARKPFFRKSFKANEIRKAMMKKQKEASGGLLDE